MALYSSYLKIILKSGSIYWFHLKMFLKTGITVSKTTISQITSSILCIVSSTFSIFSILLFLGATHKLETSVRTYPHLHKFSKINIRGFAKVIVEYSPTYHVAIKSNKKLEKSVQVVSQDGELFIKTDVSNFQQHEVSSFSINEKPHAKFNVSQNKQKGNISFIKTGKQNFLVQDGSIYTTKLSTIQDLIVIHIQAPEIKNIALNGGVHMVLKKGGNANPEITSTKGDISLEIGGRTVVNIDNLQFENFTCKLYNQGDLILQNTIINTLDVKLHGKSKISLNSINAHTVHHNARGFSEVNIISVKCKDIISNLYNEAKLDIKSASIEEEFILDMHDHAKAIFNNVECNNVASVISLENSEAIIENFKSKTLNINTKNDSKFNTKELKIEKDLIIQTFNTSKINVDTLEVSNLEVNATGSSSIKLNSGMTIYKALLNIKDRATLHMSEVPIKEAEITAIGSGEANIKVVDKLVKSIQSSYFNFNLKGESQIYDKGKNISDTHELVEKKISRKVKKKSYKIKSKNTRKKNRKKSSKKKEK